MIRIQKFFDTVEDFLTPLVNNLTPLEGETARQAMLKHGGRSVGWLDQSYGKENINKLIQLIDKTSIDYIMKILAEKNVKTLGRFAKVLNEIESNLS